MIIQSFPSPPRAHHHRPAHSSKSRKPLPRDSYKGPSDHKGYLPIDSLSQPVQKSNRWKDQILYFPMTDRFHDGDPNNNFDVNKGDIYGFHGGDLRGLTEKLDYIKELGATTLWVSPMAENTRVLDLPERDIFGYHGYWIKDHYQVEPRQGNLEDAKQLVREAHKRGLKVVLDVVLNHTGFDHPFVNDPDKRDWFHHFGDIRDWDDPFQRENGDLAGLPDLAQENPETYEYLLENTRWWVDEVGFDGIRLDAVKHVSVDFWKRFVPDLKERVGRDLFVMGEVFHGDPAFQAPYQHAGIDHIYDFPLYYQIRDTFGQGRSARQLARHFEQDHLYRDAGDMVTFIDNHDVPRFLEQTAGNGRERLKNALAFLTAARGIPMLYYGTEAGMRGGEDPHNRRDMEFGGDHELADYVTRLNELRSSTSALQLGEQLEMWQDDDIFAFARRHQGQEAVAVFNVRDQEQHRRIPLRQGSPLVDGTVLKDAISGRTVVVREGQIECSIPQRSGAIFLPA